MPYQSHSAALNLTFYTATSGASAFPAQYVGDGFAAFHGSWNRSFRTGHKLVRVRMKNGVPTGDYQDFLTGFIVSDGDAWGPPGSDRRACRRFSINERRWSERGLSHLVPAVS